jgi:hypothetical protein
MKNIVIKGWMVAIAVLVVMFGGIFLTIGTGHWAITREAEPIKLETGEYDPADIRGSYTFAELEEFFAVPADLLFKAFIIPEELRKPTFQIKNMEGLFAPVIIDGAEIEVGTDLVRVFISLYTGLPYESEETSHLPSSAVETLIQEKKLDAEQTTYWQGHVFELVPAGETPAEPVEEEQKETVEIKGGTTMGELLEYGLTKEQFKEITDIEMPDNTALGLRDFATEHELDMETVKTGILEVLAPIPTEEAAPAESPQAEETTSPSPEEEAETSIEIKGSTTIGGLLDSGMTQEQFKEITGVDLPDDTTMKLKDFADANGLDMETLKEQIIEALQQ